jgi:hypothetical protein
MRKRQSIMNAEAEAIKGRISYIAGFSNRYDPDNEADIDDLVELFRFEPDKARSGNILTFSGNIPEETGFPVSEITAVNGDFTEITLSDGSDFEAGMMILIDFDAEIEREITDVTGDVLTLESSIGTDAVVGSLAKVKCCMVATIEGGSLTPNSGEIYADDIANLFRSEGDPETPVTITDTYL